MRKAQGSLEYLLILAAILAIAVVIILVANAMLSTPDEANIINQDKYDFAVAGWELEVYSALLDCSNLEGTAPIRLVKDGNEYPLHIAAHPNVPIIEYLRDKDGVNRAVYVGNNYYFIDCGQLSVCPDTICSYDEDKEGCPDDCFIDSDGDGYSDEEEEEAGTDPNNPDEFPDDDEDGIGNNEDNCIDIPNPEQGDWNGDEEGDACDSDVPTAPMNLVAIPGILDMTLEWDAPGDMDHYNISRGGTFIDTTTSTSYFDGGLLPETTYIYAVSAFDSTGKESSDASVSEKTLDVVNTKYAFDPPYLLPEHSTSLTALPYFSEDGLGYFQGFHAEFEFYVCELGETITDYGYNGLISTHLKIYVLDRIAYVATGAGGMDVIDFADPSDPEVLLEGFGGNANDVMVVGDIAYVVGDSGFSILDITTPATPIEWSSSSVSQLKQIVVSDEIAYIQRGNQNLTVYDVSIPATPEYLGSYLVSSNIVQFAIKEEVVYVSTESDGLYSLNVSAPESIYEITRIGTPPFSDDVIGELGIYNNMLFVTERGVGGVKIFEISNPLDIIDYGQYLGYTSQIVVTADGQIFVNGGSAGTIIGDIQL